MDKRVSGVILAAGRSQRMGRPKALLPIFGTTFLEHIVHQVRASRLVDVKIVLGHRPETILDRLPDLKAATVINSRYLEGQLSSLQTGIRALEPENYDGLMLFLVDHPLVESSLIDELIAASARGPSYGDSHLSGKARTSGHICQRIVSRVAGRQSRRRRRSRGQTASPANPPPGMEIG